MTAQPQVALATMLVVAAAALLGILIRLAQRKTAWAVLTGGLIGALLGTALAQVVIALATGVGVIR